MRKKKNPREMTSRELAKHLFHPKVVKHIQKHVNGSIKSTKKA
jgi:hypothetical protein